MPEYREIMEIILASSNKDKWRQLAICFEQTGHVLVMPEEKVAVEENEPTLLANAENKALAYSEKYPGRYVLATDGGVKIPYLGDDWNHILTHRLSGQDMEEKLTNRQKCEMLLEMMKDAQGEERRASWHEAYAVARDQKIIFSKEYSSQENNTATLATEIPANFEEGGFWIGYLWQVKKFGKCYMALSDEEKKKTNDRLPRLLRELEENKIFV